LRVAGFMAVAVPAVLASRPMRAATTPRSTDKTTETIYMSATKLAELLRARDVSAVEVVNAFIDRQLEVNDLMNAVVMNSYVRARAEAKALDARAARGDFAGALHGVPMTIKDSLDTAGVITTGATYGRQQYVPEKDATVVARVRAAGAILLGKTNTPEFTLGGLSGISTASNLLYGSSHNPYDLTRSTSGSSGGAGAAVARASPRSTSARTGAARSAVRPTTTASPASSRRACACRAPVTSSTTAACSTYGSSWVRWRGASRILR